MQHRDETLHFPSLLPFSLLSLNEVATLSVYFFVPLLSSLLRISFLCPPFSVFAALL
jgi:hypothetical protein